MATAAGTRKSKRAAGGVQSTAVTMNKKKRAGFASVEGIKVPPWSTCCCWWCVTMPSRGSSGPMVAADPATMSTVTSPKSKPLFPSEHIPSMQSSRAASPDPTPPTPWNSPASTPSPEDKPSIQAEYVAWAQSSSRATSPDPTPPTPWNSPATASSDSDHNPSSPSEYASLTTPTSPVTLPEYTLSIPSEYRPLTPASRAASLEYTPASPSEYEPSIPAEYKPSIPVEYAAWAWSSRATSPDPTPQTPWNSPATTSSPEYTPSSLPEEYTPSSAWSRAASPYYTPATPHAASPDYTPSSLSGRAFSPSYTPVTPYSRSASADYTPSSSSSRCSSRASRVRRRGRRCLPTKAYRALFSPGVAVVQSTAEFGHSNAVN